MIPLDKRAHLLGGYAVAITAGILSDPVSGMVISLALWLIKECIDALGFGTPDPWDFVASAAGATAACVFLIIT